MNDSEILLKIKDQLKKQFTESEAVTHLLQIVSKLEFDLGVVKSDLAEKEDEILKLRDSKLQTKKLWLKDEVIATLEKEKDIIRKKLSESNKAVDNWRSRYFNLMAKNNNQ